MIAKAKSISHGINNIRYITGESFTKKHPELIHNVANNLMPNNLDAYSIWDIMSFQLARHPKLKNGVIRIELSPDKESTKDFTLDDWKKLWDDFVDEFDSYVYYDKNHKIVSPRTNIKNSTYTVWFHQDSKSGVPHLHAAVCRVDGDGNINNDHNIHLRAQRAAFCIDHRYGWKSSMEAREENVSDVVKDCNDILRSMQYYNLKEYLRLLAMRYGVKVRYDKDGKERGYSVKKGNSTYKASELGIGRHFTITNLEKTWRNLHMEMEQQREERQRMEDKRQSSSKTSFVGEKSQTFKPSSTLSESYNYPRPEDYEDYHKGRERMDITYNGKDYRYYLPKEVVNLFNDEFDPQETSNSKDLINFAIVLFVGLVGGVPQPHVGTGSGGTTSDLPWRKKDEDELSWARRCARYAKMEIKPKPRYRRRRR